MTRRQGRPGARQTEAELQAQVVDYLRLYGFSVWEGLKGFTGGRGAKVFLTEGVPDLYCFKGTAQGPLIFHIELKRDDGELSVAQQARHEELRRAGVPVYVAESVADVSAILALHGILRGPVLRGGRVWHGGTAETWRAWGPRGRTYRAAMLRGGDSEPDDDGLTLPPDDDGLTLD